TAGGFLDTDNIFDLREALDGGRLDVDAGAALHAVQNDGEADGFGDGLEMLVEALLRGLVVVGRDGENAVGAEVRELARERDHFGGVVTAGTGENRHFALREFHGDLDDAQMFLMGERRAFSRGATRHKKSDARGNLALDQRAQRGFIQRTIAAKGSDERGASSGK